MINLFGSPAGRAINTITSIKLNKSEAAKANAKVKNKINSVSSKDSTSSCSTILTTANSKNRDHTLFVGDQQNTIKAISGSIGIVGINNNNNNSCTSSTSTSFNHSCMATKIKANKCTNLYKKKVKYWEFLENDKSNNNWNSTAYENELKVERLRDELIT